MRANSKLMMASVAAAVLLMATPAQARDGHGHWKRDRDWHGYPVRERVVVREYIRPVPVYPRAAYPSYPVYPAYSVPAPGIHIVLPGIYIPIR